MTVTVYECEQRSDEWYAARRGLVTASQVGLLITAKTLRVADNDVSRGVTAQLVAERITGVTESVFVNDDMMRGILDEHLAVEKYAEHYAPVETAGFLVRREPDWTLGYSPDGLVGDDGLIEIKCPRAKGHIQTIINDVMPARHMAQVQAGLLVTGRQWCDFISYHAGLPLYVTRIYPDLDWHDAIRDACRMFEAVAAELLDTYESRARTLVPTERMEIAI